MCAFFIFFSFIFIPVQYSIVFVTMGVLSIIYYSSSFLPLSLSHSLTLSVHLLFPTHSTTSFLLLQCIQSCVIKLRVKRRSDSRLGKSFTIYLFFSLPFCLFVTFRNVLTLIIIIIDLFSVQPVFLAYCPSINYNILSAVHYCCC